MSLLFFSHRNYQVSTLHVEGACLRKLLGLEKLISLLFGSCSLLEKLGIGFAIATGFLPLANLNKFNFEYQGGIGRNRVPGPTLAIGIFGGELELCLLTDCHGGDTHVPSLDDLALSNCEFEWLLMI
jgi:hypothetical protein